MPLERELERTRELDPATDVASEGGLTADGSAAHAGAG
jgi:hypothetical protein